MPIRQVEITDALDRFIEAEIASGHCQDASDVMREALRTLELQKQEYEDKVATLREASAEGDVSGIFEEGRMRPCVAQAHLNAKEL